MMNYQYRLEEYLFFVGAIVFKIRQVVSSSVMFAKRKYYGWKYRTIEDAIRDVIK